MLTFEELQRKSVAEPELEFLNRFPDAREAQIYEFESERDAGEARALLITTAAAAAGHGRVLGVPWHGKWRLLAVRG